MTEYSYDEAIRQFQEHETPEQITILLSDTALQVFVAQWTMFDGITTLDDSPKPIECEHDAPLWTWIWENVDINMRALSDSTGLPPGRTDYLFKIAMANHLIYPNGAIHKSAKQYLSTQIVLALTLKKK